MSYNRVLMRGSMGDEVVVGDLAENLVRRVVLDQPVPERRAEVEAVVEVLPLDEDVRVQEVAHQATPSVRPSSRNVASFLTPSMRKASRWRVWPSSVLATSARAKRRPTRAASVR